MTGLWETNYSVGASLPAENTAALAILHRFNSVNKASKGGEHRGDQFKISLQREDKGKIKLTYSFALLRIKGHEKKCTKSLFKIVLYPLKCQLVSLLEFVWLGFMKWNWEEKF